MINYSIFFYIFDLPRYLKTLIVIIIDSFFCILSVWLAFGLLLNVWSDFEVLHWFFLFFNIIVLLIIFKFFGFYNAIFRFIRSDIYISFTKIVFLLTIFNFFIFRLIYEDKIPLAIVIIQPIFLLMFLFSSRYFLQNFLGIKSHYPNNSYEKKITVLIYGAGSAGYLLAKNLLNNNQILIKGFIDDDPNLHGKVIFGLPVFSKKYLPYQIRHLGISDIFLALPSITHSVKSNIILSLSKFGVRVRSIPSINDITSGKSKISEIHNLNINELVGREEIQPNLDLMKKNIQNKIILITGAGGSIGSELCRQIMFLQPKQIILIENTENSLYLIYEELKKLSNSKVQKYSNNTTLGHNFSSTIIYPYLSSVCDYDSLMEIFKMHKPHVVFHAAAYKHVPLLEQNFFAGVRNNVFGTLVCAQASIDSGVSNFTLVSSDKAVRPTNIMGATKRISELILQAITDSAVNKNGNLTIFSIVRFGNVIGSSGSAIPLFIDQIAAGGPVTLTDMNITRYFMTIPEAAQLLIQANGMAVGGEIFILDMGEPIRLYDLITKMINFSGFLVKDDTNPHGDIEIKICGLRPGEKLHEELFIGTNPEQTHHPKIMKVNDESVKWEELKSELDNLAIILDKFDKEKLFEVIQKLVPEYNRHKNNLI